MLYLHGMQIGMVGLLALLAWSALGLRSLETRMWIVGGVLFATVLAAIGGIWRSPDPGRRGADVACRSSGFFALDEILIGAAGRDGRGVALRRGEARARRRTSRPSWRRSSTFFAAALDGPPGRLDPGVRQLSVRDRAGTRASSRREPRHLQRQSHRLGISDEMVVGVMALTVSIAAAQFGYATLEGPARRIAGVGLAMVPVFGALAMTALYLAARGSPPGPARSSLPPPTAGSPGTTSLTGVFVMTGGLLVPPPVAFGSAPREGRGGPPGADRLGLVLAPHVRHRGGGGIRHRAQHPRTSEGATQRRPGAANDAVFTWLHQDIGRFLMPALGARHAGRRSGLVVETGPDVIWLGHDRRHDPSRCVGGMVFVFVNPAIDGPG